MREIDRLTLRIRPRSVYFLRFILEGYDNLFVLSTRDPRLGLVEICYVETCLDDLVKILKAHAPDLGIDMLDGSVHA